MIGVDSGWEIYVAGNGGIKTEVAQFLVKVKTAAEVLEYAGAFLQLYREEGWYLERTVHYVVARRSRLRQEARPRRRAEPARPCGSGCSSRSTASPIRGTSPSARASICGSSFRWRRCRRQTRPRRHGRVDRVRSRMDGSRAPASAPDVHAGLSR